MLLQLRDFIQREQLVSTQQLVREFHVDEQALQPMLDVWVSKGVIEPCQDDGCNSSCARGCKKNKLSYYIACRSEP
jgi:hypothetical protein